MTPFRSSAVALGIWISLSTALALFSGCSREDSKAPPETAMPSTGDGTIPDDSEAAQKDPHPRLLGAKFVEELGAVPVAGRVSGTWESVKVSDVPDVGHVALRFGPNEALEMVSYGLDGSPSNRQAGTYRVEGDSVQAEFPGSPEAKVSFEGDALILEDVGSGAKVRFRKRTEDLPLEEVAEKEPGA